MFANLYSRLRFAAYTGQVGRYNHSLSDERAELELFDSTCTGWQKQDEVILRREKARFLTWC